MSLVNIIVSYRDRVNKKAGGCLFYFIQMYGPFSSKVKICFQVFYKHRWLFPGHLWKIILKCFPYSKTFIWSDNQFNTFIKILRTDNDKKIFSSCFSNFMSQDTVLCINPLIHYPLNRMVFLNVYKNWYLLEVARKLLIHMWVPKQFWGVVLLTTCYLINRMHLSILNGRIPYWVLYG